jgi:hypothetical protein
MIRTTWVSYYKCQSNWHKVKILIYCHLFLEVYGTKTTFHQVHINFSMKSFSLLLVLLHRNWISPYWKHKKAVLYWLCEETHKIIRIWREDLKRISLLFHVMWPKLNCIMGWCDSSEQKYSILTCDNRKQIWKSFVVKLSFEIIIQKDDH